MKATSFVLLSIVLGIDTIHFARCEEIAVDVTEKKFELHFIYLVQTRNDRFTDHHLSKVENFILHRIEQSQDWSEEKGTSIITEIDASPSDSINTNGFCVPLGNFTNCFVIDGRMSMHALGDTTDAVARFYNMTKTAMDTDVTEDDSLFDGSVYYYRAVEEKNVYSSSDNDDSVSQQAIIMLLVLLSVGLFSLTAAVLYLLCNRAGRESRGVVAATDGRLGISAINYLGSNWLEVKSTTSSSGSSDLSETTSKVSGKVKLPQIVGNSGSSVCGSSVSDLSAQTMETSRRNFNSNTDLEKIDEEAQSTGSLDRKTANLSPFTSPGDIEDAGKDSSTKINIENSDQGKIVGQDLDEQITREADASFYTSVETPPSSSVKYKNNLESSVRRTV